MFYINENGVKRKASPEEIQRAEAYKEEQNSLPDNPSQEQRIAELEAELKATKIFLGLEV